jgi:pSer/pThr/pTyr-binding forkhead associated (FHA) protein
MDHHSTNKTTIKTNKPFTPHSHFPPRAHLHFITSGRILSMKVAVSVGRVDTCDVAILSDNTVSRAHADIAVVANEARSTQPTQVTQLLQSATQNGGGGGGGIVLQLTDKSKFGTFVNDVKMKLPGKQKAGKGGADAAVAVVCSRVRRLRSGDVVAFGARTVSWSVRLIPLVFCFSVRTSASTFLCSS